MLIIHANMVRDRFIKTKIGTTVLAPDIDFRVRDLMVTRSVKIRIEMFLT